MNARAIVIGMFATLAIGLTIGDASAVRSEGARERAQERREQAQRPSARLSEAAEEKEEGDNPAKRREWFDEWYNENYVRRGRGKQRAEGTPLWSPQYQTFMQQAARLERERYASKMPQSARSSVVLDPSWPVKAYKPGNSLNRDLRWTNIGPTQANNARNGPYNFNVTETGRVNAIVSDPANPDTLYVAFAGGGLWRSLDGGAFWQAMTETLGSLSVGTVAMDPNDATTLYLGLGDPFDGTGTGIVKMTNRAETWNDPVILGTSSSIRDILVPATNSNIVLAATDKGLYRSTDAGLHYAQVSIGGNQNLPIWSLAQGVATVTVVGGVNTNTNVILLTLRNASNIGQVWRSTDSGATWTQTGTLANGTNLFANANAGRITVAAAPSNRNVMYALAARAVNATNDFANLYRSADGGQTWTGLATTATGAYLDYTNGMADVRDAAGNVTVNNIKSRSLEYVMSGQGWYNHAIAVDPTNTDLVYFGGVTILARARVVAGAWQFTRMTDWLARDGLPYLHSDLHAMHFSRNANGTYRFYVGNDGGIFRSTDNLVSFTDSLNIGISTHMIYNVCSSPNNAARVLVGLQDNGTRLRVLDASGNGTMVYNQIFGGDGFGCNINTANANMLLGSYTNNVIHRSTDAGVNYSDVCFAGVDPATGWCNAIPNSPFRTTIAAWAGTPTAGTAPTGNTVYTFTDNVIYRSTDYFANFSTLGTTGLPAGSVIRGIASARTNNTRVAVGGVLPPDNDDIMGVILNEGRVYLTTTGGRQTVVSGVTQNGWRAAGALPNPGVASDGNYMRAGLSSITFDPVDRSIVYVTSVQPNSAAAHLWRSTDFGATWAVIDGSNLAAGATNGFPRGIPVNSVTVDHTVATTLYAATHLGVYRSLDRGNTWERFGAWLPLVNVTDVQVAADGNSARAATFGRGVWEMSDITNDTAPVAGFNVATNQLTATFTDTSTDAEGNNTIQRRIWNFGDGVSSSMTSPVHTYAQSGTYTVTLTVTDAPGLSNTFTRQVTVSNNAPPVANFTSTASNLTANFTDTSTDSDGTIASRSWNFGDSTTSTLANPSHTYAAAGTYTVTLTVTDNGGATNSVSKSVTVTAAANVPPTANFTFTTSNLTANFTDSSTDSDGTIASRSWNFGDSTTSTVANPSKTYTAAGTYTVTLTVTDNAGATNSVSKSVVVTAPASNTLSNGVAVTGIALAANTSQTWTMTVPAGATNLKFVTAGGTGDADLYVRFGSAPTTSTNDCSSAGPTTAETCSIANAQAGTYYVMVLGYSAISGVSLTGSYTAPAANVPPTANFTFTTAGLTATFTDTSTDSDGTIASRSWNFGDSTSSTLAGPSHTYAAAGTYTVTLTATDNAGGTNSVSKSVTVSAATTATQLLANPGFESGATSWTASTGVITNAATKTSRSGSWYALLGNVGNTSTKSMSQSVAITAGKTSATLSFYLKIDTAESASATTAYDTLTVQIANSAGTVLKTCSTSSNRDAGTSYVQKTCDLTPYIGQTVTVQFNESEDSSLQTSFVVDDTALDVQ